MSIKPTPRNYELFGLFDSASTWTRNALGSERNTIEDPFKNLVVGAWNYSHNYRHIGVAGASTEDELDEMRHVLSRVAERARETAESLDALLQLHAGMEEEIRRKGSDRTKGD